MKALVIPADDTQPMEVKDLPDDQTVWDVMTGYVFEPGVIPDFKTGTGVMAVSTFNHATATVWYPEPAMLPNEGLPVNERGTRLWRHFSTDRHTTVLHGNLLAVGLDPEGTLADLPDDISEYAHTNLRPMEF